MNLDIFPRLNSFPRPTHFEELVRLRQTIGCKPRIFIKRDDTTTVGLGGNKIRKLDFVLAEAQTSGADVLVTGAAVQSNHCRQTAAMARRLGMECHLVLAGAKPTCQQGNLLLDVILGAQLHFVDGWGQVNATMRAIVDELTAEGRQPYLVPIGASVPLGALGYVESAEEVVAQAAAMGVNLGYAFLASGSGGTQAGLEVGFRITGAPTPVRVQGISSSGDIDRQREKVARIASETFTLLGQPTRLSADEVVLHGAYSEEYGRPTAAGNAAITLLARTEGIICDPIYSGKALAGMLDLLARGACDDADAVVFFHTGGTPALFALADSFASDDPKVAVDTVG